MAVPVSDGQSLPGPPLAYNSDLERLEIELLLEGVYRHYGFDFRSYAYASIRRRLWKRVEGEALRGARPTGVRDGRRRTHAGSQRRTQAMRSLVSTGLVT